MTKIISLFLTVTMIASLIVAIPATNVSAAPNEEYFEFDGHTYAIFKTSSNWSKAKEFCEELGGHLVTVTSEKENSAIFNWLDSIGYRYVFLGATCESGTWHWVTEESFDYRNWHEGEPSGGSEKYLEYYFDDGTWNDTSSYGADAFVCEWDKTFTQSNSSFVMNGSTKYFPSVDMYQLTYLNTWDYGSLWLDKEINGDFNISFEYKSGGGTSDSYGGADGFVLMFYANKNYTPQDGEELGFVGCNGYGIEFDSYYNSTRNDSTSPHIALIRGDTQNHIVSVDSDTVEDGEWHFANICVQGNNIEVHIDDNLIISHLMEFEINCGDFGFSATTGAGYNYHYIKNISTEAITSSRLVADTNETSIVVYENKNDSTSESNKYVLSEGATITSAGSTYTTNSNGIAIIPKVTNGSITVEKANYISRTITAEQLAESSKVYLQKVSNGAPVISAVWVENTDVLNQSYPIGLISTHSTSFLAEVDWGSSSYGSIILTQDGKTVSFSGNNLTTVLSDNFDVSAPIFIIAKDAAGKSTKKQLNFAPGDVSSIPKVLDGAGFSISNKISVTLPDSIKPEFFAGTQISAGISSIVPVTISAEDGKVYVAIGVDLASYSSSDKWATNSTTKNRAHVLKQETKTFIDKFKDTGLLDAGSASKSLKKLANLKQTYKTAIKYPQGSFGFDADFTILGFAEGYYDSQGKLTWLDGGIILNPSVAVSTTLPFALGPVPMYFEAGLSADIQAQLNIIFNETARNFIPNGEVAGTIALSGGVGAGVKKVLYLGGGVEGKLMPNWKIRIDAQDYFKLSASVNAYAKIGIAFFEYKKSWDPFYNAVWVEYPNSQLALMSIDDIYDTVNYNIKDLSYLDEDSKFVANQNGGVMLMSELPENTYKTTEELKTNIYRESTPQYVVFDDGTQLAVWLDASDSDINSVSLYYSYHNGVSWSNPVLVNNDGTLDYAPSIEKINGSAYLVWQNATKKFSNSDNLETVAPYFDIAVAKFEAGAWSNINTISYDGLDMMPAVSGSGESIYAAWVNNSDNSWFGDNNKNSIVYAEYVNGAWSEVISIYTNLNSVDSLDVDYSDKLNFAYCVDTDGDVTTADDIFLYENGIRVTDSSIAESSPYYFNNTLYWNSDGNVVSRNIAALCESKVYGNYQIVENNEDKVLVYTTSNGLYSTLNASYYDATTHTWSESYSLTDGKTFIGAFSAQMNENNILNVLLNSASVVGDYADEDPYGTASLSLVTVSPYCDLTLGEIIFAEDSYYAGASMELMCNLTNSGSQSIEQLNVIITDKDDNELSSTVLDECIAPGETISASTYFNVEDSAKGQDIIVTVTPIDMSDVNLEDNSQSVSLKFEDLSVEEMSWGEKANSSKIIHANVVNRGYHTRDNLHISLRANSLKGQVLDTVSIDSIDALSLENIVFDISDYNKSVYYITIDNSGDDIVSNDSSFVGLMALADKPIYCSYNVSSKTATITSDTQYSNVSVFAAAYQNGKLISLKSKPADLIIGDVDVPFTELDTTNADTVKIMVWEGTSNIKPICDACVVGLE